MPVTINPTNSSTGSTATTGSSSAATGLTSKDFMHLMITQLQHQDPLSPTDSNQLLQQIAQISTLQSNQQMQSSLTSMTLQQSIGAGGNLIGKAVEGLDTNGDPVTGQVIGVQVQNEKIYLALSTGAVLPMENITTIAPAPVAAPAGNTTSTSQQQMMQNILNALSGVTS
jgi:flagellar basal-body rod modification protein FlgD